MATINASFYRYYSYNCSSETWSDPNTSEGWQGYTSFTDEDSWIRSNAVKLTIDGETELVTSFKTRVWFGHDDGYMNAPPIIANTQAFLLDANFADGENYKEYTCKPGEDIESSDFLYCCDCSSIEDPAGGLYYAVAEFSNVSLKPGTYYLLYLPKTKSHGRCRFNFNSTTEKATVISSTLDGSSDDIIATLTGVTVKVDGTTYTSGTVKIPSTADSIIVTVSGTNFSALSNSYQICFGTMNDDTSYVESFIENNWDIDTDNNTATKDFTISEAIEVFGPGFTGDTTNHGVWLTEDYWSESWVETDIVIELVYTATLTGFTLTVDDTQEYTGTFDTESPITVPISSYSKITCTITGSNFEYLSDAHVVWLPNANVTDEYWGYSELINSWDIDINTNSATKTFYNPSIFDYCTEPFEIWVSNNNWATNEQDVYTDSYDTGIRVQYTEPVQEPEEPEKCTITYNTNGGTSVQSQSVTYGESFTIRSTVPNKTSAVRESYTVTLDANGGSVDESILKADILTNYTFDHWNSAANDLGDFYKPGDTITAEGDMTLYAFYTESETIGSVRLPVAIRGGYTFRGWAKSNFATEPEYTTDYTPDDEIDDIILYAVWAKETTEPEPEPEPVATDKVYIKIDGHWKLLKL